MINGVLALAVCVLSNTISAQSGPGGVSGSTNDLLTKGLSFKTARLETNRNSDLKQGAVYLFEDVFTGVDARLKIDSLVNGAKVLKIDDNSNGLGYADALQPEVQSGNVIGRSYAVFSITFYKEGSQTVQPLQSVNATALDIDGSLTLKEFAEVNMGQGATASYMGGGLSDLSLLNLLTGKFRGDNILGIERSGIDTSSFANMYTTKNTAVSSFTIKFGTMTLLPTTDSRQFSLYMKGFTYPSQVTLPVELSSFSAMFNGDNKVELKWTTATEINVSHFVIEKSLDGKSFSDAGVVFAAGNSSSDINYSFNDKVNVSQSNMFYYRLRSVDIDGRKQYSSIRMVRIAKDNTQGIAILTYPNPVTNELRITVPASWQGKKVSYEVLSNNGRLTIRTESGNSSQTEAINVSALNSGMYLVRVSCNGETAVQKIVKQ
jgi:hypothetical protein